MRVTIIPTEHRVNVDGISMSVDCSSLPSDIHAIQWYETMGWIEYKKTGIKRTAIGSTPHKQITSIDEYHGLLQEWAQKKHEWDIWQAELAAEAAEREARKNAT